MKIRDEHHRAPLLWLLGPYLAGLLAARMGFGAINTTALGLLVLAAIGGIVFSLRAGKWATPVWAACIIAAAFGGGVANMHRALDLQPRWETLPPREVVLEVELVRVFPPSGATDRRSCIGRVVGAPVPVDDLVGQRLFLAATPPEGDGKMVSSTVLRVHGIVTPLVTNELDRQSFDAYLASSGVGFKLERARVLSVSTPPRWLPAVWDHLGHRFDRILRAGLPEHNPASAAYLAMFLGRKSELSADQKVYYLQSGTMHLFAISGLHIGVIAGCLYSLLSVTRMPRTVVAIVGLVCLWAFVESTGGTPSARRALLMIGFVWVGNSLRRPSNPPASLIASALVILVWDPLALLSTSFQLSYAVVLSILFYGMPLQNRWHRAWRPFRFIPESEWPWWRHKVFQLGKYVISLAAISVSASTVSIPLGLAYFGLASPGAILGSIVIIPFASLAVSAGFASIVFGLVGALPLSAIFNNAAALVILAIDRSAQWASAVPGMYFHGSFSQGWMSPAIVLVLVSVIIAFYGAGWRRVPGGLWIPPAVMVAALLFLVTPAPEGHQSTEMKSAYELAMERLRESDPDSDTKLTDEQKARLAEITRVYEGKIAEREIFLKQRLQEARAAGNREDFDEISKQIVNERARLEEEREDAKNKVRRAASGNA